MKLKRLLPLFLFSLMFTSLTGCGNNLTKVGILQPLGHPALDTAIKGFKQGLEDNGFINGKNIQFVEMNANQNATLLPTYAESLVTSCALSLGVGTDASIALKAASNSKGIEKPVLFTAVTDPNNAGLVSNYDAPEGFVTGSSDAQPVDAQIDLIIEAIPTVDKIGIIYTTSETNSKVQADQAKAAITKIGGIDVEEKTCSNTDIDTVIKDLASKPGIDAIYIPTDNNIAAHMSIIQDACAPKGILVVCGEEGMLVNGGHLTLSINYAELGKRAGIMAADLLKGNKSVAQTPVVTMKKDECEYVMSSSHLKEANITLSPALVAKCRDIDAK